MAELFEVDPVTPKEYLPELVGEGKKFRTVEDLAKGKAESDAFIAKLLSEQKELREKNERAEADLRASKRLEEIADRISRSREDTPISSENPQEHREQGGIDEKRVEEVIDAKLKEAQRTNTRNENLRLVQQKLRETLGNDFLPKVKEKANKLNLGEQFLNNLAAEQPVAFLALMGLDRVVAPLEQPRIPNSSVNQTSFQTGNSNGLTRDWAYYQDLKAKNPEAYKASQLQMHKDAIAAANRGEDFGIPG